MKLSRLTDYAVILLTKLSFADDEPASAARLSEDLMLPQPTVSKLLKMLTKAELLIAQRGAAGGYRLSRGAAAISIGDVIAAIEGPLALTACIDEREEDARLRGAVVLRMRGNWAVVNTAVSEALNRVTLADMAPAWMNMFGPLDALPDGIERTMDRGTARQSSWRQNPRARKPAKPWLQKQKPLNRSPRLRKSTSTASSPTSRPSPRPKA